MSLKRWHKEKWTLPDGSECGSNKDKKNPGKCRPSKRVSSDTPKTWGEMSKSEKRSAVADKSKANRENKQYGSKRFSKIKSKLKL
jgi:hypothetical protein